MPGDTCVFLGVHTRVHMGVHAMVCTGGCETLPRGRTSPDGLWHRIVSPPPPLSRLYVPAPGSATAVPPPLPRSRVPPPGLTPLLRVGAPCGWTSSCGMWASISATAGRGGSRARTAATSTAPRYPHPTDPSTPRTPALSPPTSQHPPPTFWSPVGSVPSLSGAALLPSNPPPPRPTVPSARPSGLIRPPRPHLPLPHRSAVYCANLPPSAAPWGDPAATRVGTAGTDGRSGASPGGLALPPSPRPAAPPAGQGSGRTRRG